MTGQIGAFWKCFEDALKKIACPCGVLIHVPLVVKLLQRFAIWLHGFNREKFVFSYYPLSDGCTSVEHRDLFDGCTSVEHRDLSDGCTSVEHRDLSDGCTSVEHRDLSDDCTSVEHCDLSDGCSSVEHRDLSDAYTSVEHRELSDGCSSVEHRNHYDSTQLNLLLSYDSLLYRNLDLTSFH